MPDHHEEDLDYHGSPLRWEPVGVHGIHAGRPLCQEPVQDAESMARMLKDGYGLILHLEPGDATRYSLVLTPMARGFIATRTGVSDVDAARVKWGEPVDPLESIKLCGGNPWSATLFHWWLETFRLRSGMATLRVG